MKKRSRRKERCELSEEQEKVKFRRKLEAESAGPESTSDIEL